MSQSVGQTFEANTSSDTTPTTPSPRFGCPYYTTFGQQGVKGRSCTGEGFPDAHRVKGHLYRLHAPPISCPRCYTEFKNDNEVILHLRSEEICKLMPSQDIDKTTTFTEDQRQQLKRRSPTNVGSLNESEQCEDIYRILFPDRPLPDSIYVNELEQRPAKKSSRQLTATLKELFEQQKEIKAAVTELLLAKLPKDNKYARLSSELKSYNEAAHATGFINEEGELGNHTRKRRRLLIPQQTITNGEPNMVNFNAQQSMVEGSGTPTNPTVAESSAALHTSDKTSSADDLFNDLLNFDHLGALISAPTSPQDPVSYRCFPEAMSHGL